jgi:hypothetical protein
LGVRFLILLELPRWSDVQRIESDCPSEVGLSWRRTCLLSLGLAALFPSYEVPDAVAERVEQHPAGNFFWQKGHEETLEFRDSFCNTQDAE